MTINANPFPLQLRLVQNAEPPPPRVYAEEPVRKAVPVKNPKLHSAVVGYFSGLVRNFPDKKMADRIIELAEDSDYDRAHQMTMRCGLTPVAYQDSKDFPIDEFKAKTEQKIDNIEHDEEEYGTKSFARERAFRRSSAENDKSDDIGTNSYQDDKHHINNEIIRKPKTYSGMHPDHDLILEYFGHFTQSLKRKVKGVIMHEASIGEYGSAQRKLAKNNEDLPPILDGLKFGEAQVEKIKSMSERGEME